MRKRLIKAHTVPYFTLQRHKSRDQVVAYVVTQLARSSSTKTIRPNKIFFYTKGLRLCPATI